MEVILCKFSDILYIITQRTATISDRSNGGCSVIYSMITSAPSEGLSRGLRNSEDSLPEEDMGDQAGSFPGSSIEVTPRDPMEVFRKYAQKFHAVKGRKTAQK